MIILLLFDGGDDKREKRNKVKNETITSNWKQK